MARAQRQRQPKPPQDMSDKTSHDLFPPKFLKPDYDFNNQSQVVKIRKVFKEEVWSSFKNKWEYINIVYFENLDRGIKLIKEQNDMLVQWWGSDIKNWIGKDVTLVPVKEAVAGTTHDIMRISNKMLEQEEPEPENTDPITEDQLEDLTAYGFQLYDDEWEERQKTLALYISNDRVDTLDDLYEHEAAALIEAVEDKLVAESEEDISNPEEIDFMGDDDDK